jgi:small subunit ribosomal protein S17
MAEEKQDNETTERADVQAASTDAEVAENTTTGEMLAHNVAPNVDSQPGNATGTEAGLRGNRAQKVGIVASDKMEKTVVVRVDRLIKHSKYRRYVRRTSKFMAHDETGATIGDKVRIVETRPLSARKRWRVVEIVQKAAK